MLDAVRDSGSCRPYQELQIRSCHSLIAAFSNKQTHTHTHTSDSAHIPLMSYPTTPLPRGPILIPGCCTDTPHISHCPSLHTLFQAVHLFHPLSLLSSFLITIILSLLFSAPSLLHLPILLYPTPTPSLSVKLRISTLKMLNKCCLVSDAPVSVHVWPPSPRLLPCSRPCFAVLICFMYTSFCWYCICASHAMCLLCTCLIVFVSFCLDNASSKANGNNYDHYIEGRPGRTWSGAGFFSGGSDI